jgi:hypothetical protein
MKILKFLLCCLILPVAGAAVVGLHLLYVRYTFAYSCIAVTVLLLACGAALYNVFFFPRR